MTYAKSETPRMTKNKLRSPVRPIQAMVAAALLLLCLACGPAASSTPHPTAWEDATADTTAAPVDQPGDETDERPAEKPTAGKKAPAEPTANPVQQPGDETDERPAEEPTAGKEAPAEPTAKPVEQPGDETEPQRVVREATIAAIQTEHARTPTKDTSHMFRLSLEESACLRERSPDGRFSKFMRAVTERDLETTKALHHCLTRETAIVLLLMDHGGVAPELSDETWTCINEQTEGIDIKAALALKHGLEPEKPQELDAFTLAGVAPLAMLVCVSDEEFDANRARLGTDADTRRAVRCMAQAAGGLEAMILASMDTDPAASAAYEEEVTKCTAGAKERSGDITVPGPD